MKATGIVRRIDDLGRIVIPKEIRRTLRIREGDPLEIYTEKDGEVIFKKYSPTGRGPSAAQSHHIVLAHQPTASASFPSWSTKRIGLLLQYANILVPINPCPVLA